MSVSRTLLMAASLAAAHSPAAAIAEQQAAPGSPGETVPTPTGAGPSPATAERTADAPQPPFGPGEQIDAAVDFRNVRAGQVQIVVGRAEGHVWPVICQGRTDGMGSLLDIREHYVSYWDAEAGMARGSDLSAIEVGDRHTDRARFDRDRGEAVVEVVRKGILRQRTHHVPSDVQDLLGALLRLRSLPLEPGAHHAYPVFSGSDTFVLQADVEGQETVDTPAGRFEAVRVRVRLGFKEGFATRRDALVWISRDARRVPVKVSAEFALGTVTATLTGYRPGRQLASAP